MSLRRRQAPHAPAPEAGGGTLPALSRATLHRHGADRLVRPGVFPTVGPVWTTKGSAPRTGERASLQGRSGPGGAPGARLPADASGAPRHSLARPRRSARGRDGPVALDFGLRGELRPKHDASLPDHDSLLDSAAHPHEAELRDGDLDALAWLRVRIGGCPMDEYGESAPVTEAATTRGVQHSCEERPKEWVLLAQWLPDVSGWEDAHWAIARRDVVARRSEKAEVSMFLPSGRPGCSHTRSRRLRGSDRLRPQPGRAAAFRLLGAASRGAPSCRASSYARSPRVPTPAPARGVRR